MKTGIVLEGGGMRGMYTAGVLDVMMENEIKADGAVGVSAGAVFGCNYKSMQIGRAFRYNLRYCRDPRYVGLRSLIKTGDLYGEQFCYHEIPDKLDPFDIKTYAANPMEFYVVCTDIREGKAVYHLCSKGDENDIQWMRASASMPLVSRIVSLDGYDLLDGGISDSIPIEWFRSIGYNKNIVVLTRPAGYIKTKNRFTPLIRAALKKYPAVAKLMANRHNVYNKTLEKIEALEKSGEVFVIRPSSFVKISRTERNPERLRAMYQLGRKDAEAKLKQLTDFMG